jgi:hypothetical protein
MNIDGFSYKDFLPYYLTAEQKNGLANAMRDFSGRSHIYTSHFPDDVLQGDCWEKMPFMDFSTGKKDKLKVLVLSNSCDIDASNSRDFPIHMTYAPIIGMAQFEQLLVKLGYDAKIVAGKVEAIKSQKITSMIFLPASAEVENDGIALLDRAISVPFKAFLAEKERRKVVSLNQFGHYLLSFKLSIHFCRIHEGIVRG